MSHTCADIQPVLPQKRHFAPERHPVAACFCRLLSGPTLAFLLITGFDVQAQTTVNRDIQVVEGDILVSRQNKLTRSVSLSQDAQLWSDGIVPYSIDPSLSANSTEAVKSAVAHWNRVSGIVLISLQDWPAGQAQPRDSIRFQPGEGCASWVGRLGEVQEIWVADNCAAGSVMHEIGHALGLEHEHTRPDRDQFIQINWDNIAEDKRHNFDVAPSGSRILGEYDYESIMHYGPSNFSHNGKATITPLLVSEDTIGQRVAPSRGDLAAIASLYGTDLSIVTQVYSDVQNTEVNIHVSNELSQGANTIEVDVQVGAARLLEHAGSGWQCGTLTDGQLSCSLARLAGGNSSLLVLTLGGELLSEDVTATVRSKTPDDDTLNNADSFVGTPEPTAASALADTPAFTTTTTTTYGAAAFWLWPLVFPVLFQRQAGHRIYRQPRYGIEGFWRRRIAAILHCLTRQVA